MTAARPGIYVEILLQADLNSVWRLTQTPELHQRWDLRFTGIHYLPRPSPSEPQRFLYETRIGFGLAVRGTGESIGQRTTDAGDATSSLSFASDDPKSLIREGSGYWRYVPTPGGLRFFTWYDYRVRFGSMGRLVDRIFFRPLMGWATAWSFDRLRLWAEAGQTPEVSLTLSLIHALCRVSIALIWLWHGLVPKLLFRNLDEQRMLQQAGLSLAALPWLGAAEILFGAILLVLWRVRPLLLVNAGLMLLATAAVGINSPTYFRAAFNPFSLNLAVFTLSLCGWFASRSLPSAKRCRRTPPQEHV